MLLKLGNNNNHEAESMTRFGKCGGTSKFDLYNILPVKNRQPKDSMTKHICDKLYFIVKSRMLKDIMPYQIVSKSN